MSSFFCRSSWATSWMLRVTSDQYLPLHLRPVSADRWSTFASLSTEFITSLTEILCLKTSASTDEVCLQCLDVNLPWGQRDAQLGKKPNFAPSGRTVKSLILESCIEIYCIYLYYLYCIQYIHAYQYYIQDIQIKIYYLVNKHLVFPFITWVFFLSSWKCA